MLKGSMVFLLIFCLFLLLVTPRDHALEHCNIRQVRGATPALQPPKLCQHAFELPSLYRGQLLGRIGAVPTSYACSKNRRRRNFSSTKKLDQWFQNDSMAIQTDQATPQANPNRQVRVRTNSHKQICLNKLT
jgi:hypothetical protein